MVFKSAGSAKTKESTKTKGLSFELTSLRSPVLNGKQFYIQSELYPATYHCVRRMCFYSEMLTRLQKVRGLKEVRENAALGFVPCQKKGRDGKGRKGRQKVRFVPQ